MPPAPTTWVLSDGRAGNERQALALARALSPHEPRVWRLETRAPWRQAAPRKLPGSAEAFGESFRDALRDPPALAIGCGRQAALATRLLREAGARAVQILDPRIDPRHWDAVVVPEHDALRGANVITSIGGLHAVDADALARARAAFPQFAHLSSPRMLLLLGGPVRSVPLDAAWWRRTVDVLRAIQRRDGGSLSLCASPRTPAWLVDAVRRERFDRDPGPVSGGVVWLTDDDGPNPYPGLLAWAERIVVSPDSVNMASEAAATGASVAIAEPALACGRHAAFLASLLRLRAAAPLDADAPFAASTVLRELPRVAALVRERLGW